MSHESLRDRVFGLLYDLCGTPGSISPDTLRITSHSLLNLADDAGSDALRELAEALPWVSAFLALSREGMSAAEVAATMASHQVIRALSREAITRRLEPAEAGQIDVARRHPPGDTAGQCATILKDLARLDRALLGLTMRSVDALRESILGDVRLLSVAVECCEDGVENETTRRLLDAFPEWSGAQGNAMALNILAGLETSWNGGSLSRLPGLSERARRFELSSTDHLRRHGVIVAVRAALAFSDVGGQDVKSQVLQLPVFREDMPLAHLTAALIEMRGDVLRHVRGASSLASLHLWTDYLRGSCADLAESREISIREATSFAHYALHLMNFCDLVATLGSDITDDIRQALLDVEEELKEFALIGQREGYDNEWMDLERYEQSRWKSTGSVSYVADRLARLRGGWRDGTKPRSGGGHRVASSIYDHSVALVERISEQARGLAVLLGRAELQNTDLLEDLDPMNMLRLLVLGLSAARDLAGVDVSRPFRLDLEPLTSWVREDSTGMRRTVLSQLLGNLSVESSLEDASEPSMIDHGLTFRVRPDDLATVEFHFVSHPELEAVLTLLSSKASSPPALRESLYERLYELVEYCGRSDGEAGEDVSEPGEDTAQSEAPPRDDSGADELQAV